MSFAHLGYPVGTATPTLPQPPVTSRASPKSPDSPCCETGRPIMTDPVTGQTICSCQYGSAAAALYAGAYPRVPGLPEAFYNSAAMAAQAQGLLPQLAVAPGAGEPPALYAGLASPYDFKGLATAGGLYPYDPSLAAYPYAAGFLDPNARRKNATRESTQTLKAWLNEHKKNPYPTKGEKIMLAIITKMTLTQVSTWFANARRRLKKENKMTWEPRNRMDDDDDDINSDVDEDDKRDDKFGEDENISVDSDDEGDHVNQRNPAMPGGLTSAALLQHRLAALAPSNQHLLMVSKQPNGSNHPLSPVSSPIASTTDSKTSTLKDYTAETSSATTTSSSQKTTSESDSPKPKIWSMAEIAASSTKDSTSNSGSTISSHSNSINSSILSSTPTSHHHQNKMPSVMSQGLHPAWRGTAHPYLHPHFAQRLAAFPGGANQAMPRPMLPAFASIPQLRHNDGTRISAFSPPSSTTSPTSQSSERNV